MLAHAPGEQVILRNVCMSLLQQRRQLMKHCLMLCLDGGDLWQTVSQIMVF